MTTKQQTVNVLSIDAWRTADGWTWNNWHKVGSVDADTINAFAPDGKLNVRKFLNWARTEGYLSAASAGKLACDDDCHNYVILNKNTREPLYAVPYAELPEVLPYKIIVGNIGEAANYASEVNARAQFEYWVSVSKSNHGRAAGEPVTLMHDNEILCEYQPDDMDSENDDSFACKTN